MNLGKRAVKSTVLVAATSYASEAVNFVVSIILARLLLPEHFGIVALAMFFLELFGRVREFGFDQALIHRRENLEAARATHFLLHLTAAALSLFLGLISSPLLLRFYTPETVKVFLIFSFVFLFKAASATQRVVLEKELLFAYTTLIDFLALVFSSILAVFMAASGAGLWSLVVYQTTNTLFAFVALWLIRPWKLKVVVDKESIVWFLKFGVFLWLGGLTTFILFKYNDFIAGTFLGAATLGFYSRAFSFAQRPTSSVTSVISRVALPTYSLIQEDKAKLSYTFNFVLRNIVRLSAPLSLILFLLARDFTLALLGDKWLPMVPIFRLLLIYGFLRSVFDDAGAFLTAIGKPNLVSLYLGIQAVTILFSTPLLVGLYGIEGAAVSLDFALIIGLVLAYFYVSRFVKVDLFGAFVPLLAPVLLTTIFFFLFGSLFSFSSHLFTFSARLIFTGGSYLLLSLISDWVKIKEDFLFLWRQFRQPLEGGTAD